MSGFGRHPPSLGSAPSSLSEAAGAGPDEICSRYPAYILAQNIFTSVVFGHEEPSVRRTRDFRRPSWHMMKCD